MSEFQFKEEEFESDFNGTIVRRILKQLLPHWRMALGFLLSIFVVSALDSVFTYISKLIVDNGILANQSDVLYRLAVRYGILLFVQAIFVFAFIYFTGVLGHKVRFDLRKKLFEHIQELSLSYFDKTPVGWIMSRVTSDVDRVAELATWGLLDVVWGVTNIITAVIFMMVINWRLGLIVLAIIPVLLFVAAKFQKKIIYEYRDVRRLNSEITGAYNENITGVRVVKALRREEGNLEEFSALSGSMYRAGYRAAWFSALFLPTVQLISAVALGFVVFYGGGQAASGRMTIGDIQAFVSYVTFMLWPIQDLARVYAEMQRSIASAERIFSLLDTVPEILDSPNAENVETISGLIEFDHVDFFYEEEKDVLKDFSLTVRPGEMIALVGPTGGGKTTLVNLLCRFYEPKRGQIRLNGQDYTQITQRSIQSRVGMVLQTPHLFSGTIRENLLYGRLDATEEEMTHAADLAGALPFILKLEKGFDEEVGEGGNLLSVGQKQLISIARAILADPEILILDEATSSVDTLTEMLIQQGMRQLMEGRTSFIVAHRLSTIKRADRIIVIENGGISEMGTHGELLKARGHYYNLFTQQFRKESSKDIEIFGMVS